MGRYDEIRYNLRSYDTVCEVTINTTWFKKLWCDKVRFQKLQYNMIGYVYNMIQYNLEGYATVEVTENNYFQSLGSFLHTSDGDSSVIYKMC